MDLLDIVVGLAHEVAELKRRVNQTMRPGTVKEVDAAKQLVRVKLAGGDDGDLLTPWLPYAQYNGQLKGHTPLSVGQHVSLNSRDGDWETSVVLPYSFTDDNPSPSQSPDENVWTFKGWTIKWTDGAITVEKGGTKVTITPANVTIKSNEVITDGTTKLDKGTRQVVFKGSHDSGGDENNEGAERVFV